METNQSCFGNFMAVFIALSFLPFVMYSQNESEDVNIKAFNIDSLKGDERNIAVLARAYNNLPLDYIKK